jgi:hypothetical protein
VRYESSHLTVNVHSQGMITGVHLDIRDKLDGTTTRVSFAPEQFIDFADSLGKARAAMIVIDGVPMPRDER